MNFTLNDVKQLINEQTEEIKQEINKKLHTDILPQINELRHENDLLKLKIEQLEQKLKKNNVVVHGIPTNVMKNKSESHKVLNFLNEKLGTALSTNDISNLSVLGKNNKTVLIEFIKYNEKAQIFKNVAKLKGSNIYISNDLTTKERTLRKLLLPYYRQAKSAGKQAKLLNSHILIDDVKYNLDELQKDGTANKEEELNDAYDQAQIIEVKDTTAEGVKTRKQTKRCNNLN